MYKRQFKVSVLEEASLGSLNAIIPEVEGTANIVGKHTFWIDPDDDIGKGFMLR